MQAVGAFGNQSDELIAVTGEPKGAFVPAGTEETFGAENEEPEEVLGYRASLAPEETLGTENEAPEERSNPAPSAIEQVKESLRMAQALMDEIEKGERSRHYMLTKLQAAEGAMEDCAVAADDLADKFGKAHALLVELSAAVRERP